MCNWLEFIRESYSCRQLQSRYEAEEVAPEIELQMVCFQDLQLVGELSEGMGVMAYSILICDGEGMDQAQEQKSHLVQ